MDALGGPRPADADFALPGTLTERHIRCGKPDCRCTVPASRSHLTLRIAERAEGWTEKSR